MNIPVSDILEELIGAEMLDIDIDQTTGAQINAVAAHLFQVEVIIPEKPVVSHVDGAPHETVLADSAPLHAHLLSSRQDCDGVEAGEYRRRDILRELQPVPVASGSAPVRLAGGFGH